MIKIPDSRTANFNFRKIFSKLHFLGLDDTPKSYRGQGGKGIMVREDERGLTFGLPSGSLIGEGTAGQVTVWGANNTLTGYDDLFFDSTNKRLGIGTNTPVGKLTIKNDVDVVQLLALDSDNAELFRLCSNKNLNLFLGYEAGLATPSTASNVMAIGCRALKNNLGNSNLAIGQFALMANVNGENNTALGEGALQNNIGGRNNTAFGLSVLLNNISGAFNVAFGEGALRFNTTGMLNISIGYAAGDNITTGSNNIIIGNDLDAPSATNSYQMLIGGCLHGKLDDGYIGIGAIPTTRFSVMEKFQVDDNGNLTLINNVAYSFPAVGGVGYFYRDADGNVTFGAGGGANHNLLDGDVHPDTLADAVTRGGLVVGQFSVEEVKWKLLTLGSLGQVLYSNGTDAIWAQLSHTKLSDIGTNTHTTIDTFISSKGQANGLASLTDSSLVVQNPATAMSTPTPGAIPIADGSAKLDGWITPALIRDADDWRTFPQKTTLVDDDIILIENSESSYEKAWITFKDFKASLGI